MILYQNNGNKGSSLKLLENLGVLLCQKSEGIAVLWESFSAQLNWSLLSWELGERLVQEGGLGRRPSSAAVVIHCLIYAITEFQEGSC